MTEDGKNDVAEDGEEEKKMGEKNWIEEGEEKVGKVEKVGKKKIEEGIKVLGMKPIEFLHKFEHSCRDICISSKIGLIFKLVPHG